MTIADALTAAEGKSIFLGYDMNGVIEGTKTRWRECVNPNGTTAYWVEGDIRKGFLRIRDDGALCFSYPDPQHAAEDCFFAAKKGAGWRFTYEQEGGDTFIATSVKKVAKCPGPDTPVS